MQPLRVSLVRHLWLNAGWWLCLQLMEYRTPDAPHNAPIYLRPEVRRSRESRCRVCVLVRRFPFATALWLPHLVYGTVCRVLQVKLSGTSGTFSFTLGAKPMSTRKATMDVGLTSAVSAIPSMVPTIPRAL